MANRIRQLRHAAGISLDDVAHSIGATNQQVSLLETGKRRLTADWLVKLGNAIGCHPWELVSADLPSAPDVKELKLLDRFRRLSAEQQRAILGVVQSMVDTRSPRPRKRKAPR